MRVLALVPAAYDTSPGQRFRMEQWEPLLREAGVAIDWAPFEDQALRECLYQQGRLLRKASHIASAWRNRGRTLRTVLDYDLVYVFREAALLGPPVFEKRVHRSGVPMVFDFDDAIFVPYVSPSNGYWSILKFPGKTGDICWMSRHVMVGNPYLAEYARQFNSSVTVIPTTIDTAKYTLEVAREPNNPPVIGWSGSYSTLQYLDQLHDPLRELARRVPFRFRVIGTPRYAIDGVPVESVPWNAATEVADLRVLDVGLMPLPDDAWSQGKCGLKALQYMALGTPTICSPVGVNSAIIQHDQNGLLATTPEEWVDAMERLVRHPEERRRLGLAGRATVEADYSAHVQAPRVLRVFEEAVRPGPPSAPKGRVVSATAGRDHV